MSSLRGAIATKQSIKFYCGANLGKTYLLKDDLSVSALLRKRKNFLALTGNQSTPIKFFIAAECDVATRNQCPEAFDTSHYAIDAKNFSLSLYLSLFG